MNKSKIISAPRKSNSRAIMSGSLVKIIMVLLIFIVLAGAVVLVIKVLTAKSDREVCRTGVLAQAITKEIPKGERVVLPDCKTYNVVFKDDRVEINDKAIEVYDDRKNDFTIKFSGLTNQIVNRVVAEELRWCWYQLLEGNRKVLSKAGVVGQVRLLTDEGVPDLCYLCDEITFDSSVTADEFTGLYEYMQTRNMIGTNMTYYYYIADSPRICESYEGEPCWEEFYKDLMADKTGWETPSDTVLEKDKKYVIMFIKHGVDARGAGTIGIGYRENYFAYIMPSESVFERCDSMLRGSAK